MPKQGHLVNAFLFLLFIFAILFVITWLTRAHTELFAANLFFLALAVVFFLLSVFVWIVSWAFLIKRSHNVSYKKMLVIGFSSMYGSISPVQLGAEALRSFRLKKQCSVPLTESIASAMVVKGLKFLTLGFVSSVLIFLIVFNYKTEPLLLISLFSGFFVVVAATLLFLLPLKRGIGLRIASFFAFLGKKVHFFGLLAGYFENYSNYLQKVSFIEFSWVFFLSFFSWVLEFLAFYCIFVALGFGVPFFSMVFLFVLLAVIERTPFLPRGILLFELAGFAFLSMPALSGLRLSIGKIGSFVVLFDFVRLVVPALFSILFYSAIKLKQTGLSKKNSLKSRLPK